MKARIIIITLSVFMFMTCSYDGLEDPFMEPTAFEMDQMKSEVAVKQSKPFNLKLHGEFEIVTPVSCRTLKQIDFWGAGDSNIFGISKSMITRCTDFKKANYIKGAHVSMTGDQLFFYSDESGSDARGDWYSFIYSGGTGKFAEASGKARVYIRMVYFGDAKEGGQFILQGEGMLSY